MNTHVTITEDNLHYLACLVMDSINPSDACSLDEFIMEQTELTKPQKELCEFVLNLFDKL